MSEAKNKPSAKWRMKNTDAKHATNSNSNSSKPVRVSSEKTKLQAIGKFGKVPVPLNFIPGGIRLLTAAELKSGTPFEARRKINEIETDREHATAVQLGGSGSFRIRHNQRVFLVQYKAGYVSGPVFNVDGIDFDLDHL